MNNFILKLSLIRKNLVFLVLYCLFCVPLHGQMYTQSTFDAKIIDVNLATGSIGASSNVGNGAAGYSIPLVLPPGTNGVVPEISINYSSTGGSSAFGYGWGLSGLSIITRVGQTKYYDNQIKPVNLNADDRY